MDQNANGTPGEATDSFTGQFLVAGSTVPPPAANRGSGGVGKRSGLRKPAGGSNPGPRPIGGRTAGVGGGRRRGGGRRNQEGATHVFPPLNSPYKVAVVSAGVLQSFQGATYVLVFVN